MSIVLGRSIALSFTSATAICWVIDGFMARTVAYAEQQDDTPLDKEARMADIDDIKAKLEARLLELDERAHEIEDNLSEPPDSNWSENATESENDEVLESMGDMAMHEIRRIKSALSKIEEGTYGICESCDKKIPPKRLEALPYATLCVKCAEATAKE